MIPPGTPMPTRTPAKKLFLVDGTSQLYRAYFAIRGLSNRDGLPTNAIYGFTTMLRKMLADEQPEHIAVAFDLGRKVFRHEQFPDYKANRPPTPEDLKVQVPYAKQVCEVLGVPRLELKGYEADDLIATFAERARQEGLEVVVVASDKDLYQLVGEGITVLNPSKNLLLDSEGVEKEFGVPPERVRDVLGLMGDSVDNIPGVPGVGQKTALAAVSAYGPVESVIERAVRFTAAYDARDGLVAEIDALAAEESASKKAVTRLREAVDGFCGRVSSLVEIESDEAQADRLRAAATLAAGADPEAGQPGRKAARALGPLKRELRALDRGSSKRIWYAIRDHAEQARLSKELATLSHDAPLEYDLERLRRAEPDVAKAAALFGALEFRALVDELAAGAAEPSAATTESEPASVAQVVLSSTKLKEVAASCRDAERIAIRALTEDGSPLRSSLVGLALSCGAGRAYYIPLAHAHLGVTDQLPLAQVVKALGGVLADPDRPKVAHDLKSISHVLRRHDLVVAGWRLDTMVAAFLLDAGRSSYPLDGLVREYLGPQPERNERPERVSEMEIERVAAWAAADAGNVERLAEVLETRLGEAGLSDLYREIDGPLLPLLARIEANGILVDTALLSKMSAEMESSLGKVRERIHSLAGEEFNVDSPKQLREILFVKLGLQSRRKTAKGREASTDAQTLELLLDEHPIAGKLLEYRELAKLKGTYVDALPRLVDPSTGRVHTSYHPTGAATGRLSSSDPNLQNIPARTATGRKIRAAFVPEEGSVFLAADYSQIELRVLAHLTGDPELTAAFRAGEDIHRHTAARVFDVMPELVTPEMRRRAKVVNFGVLYGMSEHRLAREQGISRKEARRFIETYFARFARVREYIDEVRELARRDGAVRTLFGRVRRFPQLQQRVNRAVQEQALRGAVNTTVQGTAADLMKLAMLEVDHRMGESPVGARILLQVHDELLLEVPEESVDATAPLVRRAMEGVATLAVPLVVDQKVGKSWMEVT
jgi:DNA polymerase-1